VYIDCNVVRVAPWSTTNADSNATKNGGGHGVDGGMRFLDFGLMTKGFRNYYLASQTTTISFGFTNNLLLFAWGVTSAG
jgi:hypothetical protein